MERDPETAPGTVGTVQQRAFSRVLLASLVVGVLLHLVGFLVFRVVYRDLPDREAGQAFVRFAGPGSEIGGGTIWEEEVTLLDSAPLFVPTRWNAGAGLVLPKTQSAPRIFTPFPPPIDLLAELVPSRLLAPGEEDFVEPASILGSRFWSFFSRFGMSPGTLRRFPDTGTVARVEDLVGQQPPLQIEAELPGEVLPGVMEAVQFHVRKGWGELGFFPLLVKSSGSADFDAAAADWLVRPEIWSALPPGYSRVSIFP